MEEYWPFLLTLLGIFLQANMIQNKLLQMLDGMC